MLDNIRDCGSDWCRILANVYYYERVQTANKVINDFYIKGDKDVLSSLRASGKTYCSIQNKVNCLLFCCFTHVIATLAFGWFNNLTLVKTKIS